MSNPQEVAYAARSVIYAVMAERLTETERRRVSLLYGLDTNEDRFAPFSGRALSERQVAGLEGVHQKGVQEVRDTALDKLEGDWRLWVLAVLVEAQYVRWFDCDHCKSACDYPEGTGVVTEKVQVA